MTRPDLDRPGRVDVSEHYPPHVREQLVAAGQRRDEVAIDHITDQLASMGLARPRTCTRLFPVSVAAESRRSST